MLLFSGQGLCQSFDGKDIFHDVNLEVQIGEKVGLVGTNGVGKTTLLKIIAGIGAPTAGKVTFFKPVTRTMLAQLPCFSDKSTIREALESAAPQKTSKSQVDEALKRFHFSNMEYKKTGFLSCGEKTRLQLASLWLQQTELLLLDEPTNHLDIRNLNWLEGYIQNYSGTVIIVSHDRYFLDKAVTRILELRADGVSSYPGNYSYYKEAKRQKYEADLQTFYEQEKESRRIDGLIREQKQWADKGHRESRKKGSKDGPTLGGKEYYRAKAMKTDCRAKNNIKRLERLQSERIAKPKKTAAIDLSFHAAKRGSGNLIMAEGLRKSFGSFDLLINGDFAISYGEKVALVGENGAGKTTLLKMILGMETPDSGELWLSPSLKTGYLPQELPSFQNASKCAVIDEVLSDAGNPGLMRARARNLLASLLIKGEMVNKACEQLSCGERVRVALAKLLLNADDLLILDEPTNYLDMESRERLEEALLEFNGSLIIVSHDRYLLERVCNRVWSFEEKTIKTYPGRYSDYENSKGMAPVAEKEATRLKLELQLAFLTGELAKLNAEKNTEQYLRLEEEYFKTIGDLRQLN